MGIFRNRENYDNYERDNFDNGNSYSNNNYERTDRGGDNNFDRMYDSREYSRDVGARRYEERNYQRSGEYPQDGARYPQDGARYPQDRPPYEQAPQRDYRSSRYARFEDRPSPNDGYYEKYPREAEGARPNAVKDNQVVFSSPRSYGDIQNLIDSLKKKQSLIVDVSGLDSKDTQRYLDFLSGAIYALGGSYQKIDNKKFYFAPQGVSITIPYDLRQKKE